MRSLKRVGFSVRELEEILNKRSKQKKIQIIKSKGWPIISEKKWKYVRLLCGKD